MCKYGRLLRESKHISMNQILYITWVTPYGDLTKALSAALAKATMRLVDY